MKSVIAGVAGVLVATLGVAAWQARTAAPAYRVSNVAGFADAAATLPGATTAAQGLPLVVRCAPGQQAVMRQIVVGGQLTAAAECTDAAMPVAYGASLVQPVSSDIVQWQQPRIVPASYTVRERAPRRVVVREGHKRNWGKTALVIGGSAGAGAGVGAIAGGKKGALIGAAIGGGAASLFEALKK